MNGPISNINQMRVGARRPRFTRTDRTQHPLDPQCADRRLLPTQKLGGVCMNRIDTVLDDFSPQEFLGAFVDWHDFTVHPVQFS